MHINEKALAKTLEKFSPDVRHTGVVRAIIQEYQFLEAMPQSILERYENLRKDIMRYRNMHPDTITGCRGALGADPRSPIADHARRHFAEELALLLDLAVEHIKD